MTRPEGAADQPPQLAGTAGQAQRADSLAEPAEVGKQAVSPVLRLGTCANCGIRLVSGATTCPTCTAWRRWYVAHRIASRLLREAMR